MITFASLNQQQKFVVWSSTTAVIFSTVFVLIAYFLLPVSLPPLNTQEQRLIWTLQFQIFPAFMLLAGIVTVSFNRFIYNFTNPLVGGESTSMRVHQRYLSNTLEQTILFIVASLILSSFLDSHSIKLIPIFTILFVLGRIAFWWGYLQHPLNRSFGMAVTLYPTLIILFYDAFCLLCG